MKHLLKLFHILPDGLKLYLRSFKTQEPELYELGWLVEKGTIAVDVGANKGAYTYALSRAVGRSGQVVAVEPIEGLAAYLQRACDQLSLPVRVEQCCLSAVNGEGELFIPVTAGRFDTGFASLNKRNQNEGELRKVKLRRLDDMLRERNRRVSFIKCDVEGHELEVFLGAVDILKSDRPNLLVEIEQRHLDRPIEAHFDFFRKQGYTCFFLDGTHIIRELREFDMDDYQTAHLNVTGAMKEQYVYNFIFLPAETADPSHLRAAKRYK